MNPNSDSLLTICRKTLQDKLRETENDTLTLRVPTPSERQRITEAAHLHLLPEPFFQLSGATRFNTPQGDTVLSAGEMAIIPPGVIHNEFPQSPRSSFSNLVVQFLHNITSFHLATSDRTGIIRVVDLIMFRTESPTREEAYFDDAAKAFLTEGPYQATRLKGAMLAGLSGLLELLEQPPVSTPTSDSYKTSFCMQMVFCWLDQPDLSVSRLARMLRCSSDYLSNLFRRDTGMRLTQYINQQRIDKARQLLDKSSLNISEVALACGYSDPGYFSRVFSRTVGVSPGKYRKQVLARPPRVH